MTDPHVPLAVHRFTLTRADALAYESSRPRTGWRHWAFLIWLGLGGIWVGLLPEAWKEGWRFWVIGAVAIGAHYLVATAVLTILTHTRAARRVRVPVEVELEEWGDHLTMQRGDQHIVVALETIAATALTPTHLFIHVPPEVLIVPRSAFPDSEDAATLAARIEDADREP